MFIVKLKRQEVGKIKKFQKLAFDLLDSDLKDVNLKVWLHQYILSFISMAIC